MSLGQLGVVGALTVAALASLALAWNAYAGVGAVLLLGGFRLCG
jgi:hypothetical protein